MSEYRKTIELDIPRTAAERLAKEAEGIHGLAAALVILAGRCASEADSDVMIRAARVLRAQPARDAAEGARPSIDWLAKEIADKTLLMMSGRTHYLQHILKCAETIQERLAAPPKPAPDAMREATPEQLAAAERGMAGLEAQADIWAEEVRLVDQVKAMGDVSRGLTDRMPADVRNGFIDRQEAQVDAIARQAYLEGFYRGGESRKDYDDARALSAPVPPGDGARERLSVPFNPCLAKLREGEPFFVLLGRDKQAPNAVMTWANDRQAAEGKSAWTDQAREIAYEMAAYSGLAALSPPCAGAAEPVSTPQQVQEACAQVADRFHERWTRDKDSSDAKSIAAAIRALIPPAPAPPVRGDREKIARSLAKSLWSGATFDDGTQAERDAFLNAADNLLSLPVQPGAGEREWFGIDSAPENQAVEVRAIWGVGDGDIGEDIKFTHWRPLSRQAPHSSSEGGR